MQKLTLKHVMTLARIIKKANLKESIKNIVKDVESKGKTKGTEKMSVEAVGLDVFMTVLEACANKDVETEVYSFLDEILGVKSRDMPLDELGSKIKELAEENNLESFFKAASQLNR